MRTKLISIPLALSLAAPMVLVAPAQADSFPRRAVQSAIEKQIRQVVGQAADVKCPARSTWRRGAVFFCKANPTDGSADYRVRVTLRSKKDWHFDWLQVP